MAAATQAVNPRGAHTGRALGGFFLSGILMSLVGALLPAWGYHRGADYSAIAGHFLSLNVGLLISISGARKIALLHGPRNLALLATGVAAIALCYLAFVPPQAPHWWRTLGILWLGVAAGWLNAAIFQAISSAYERDRAATINFAGVLFGLGCFVTALFLAGTFYIYSVRAILLLFACVPLAFATLFWFSRFDAPPPPAHIANAAADFRSPLAVLLSLLLFFQFGNEWAIGGWLPLYLNQSAGMSPATSLLMLAVYWLALLVGRLAIQAILPKASHARVLAGSVAVALLGCIILAFTDNRFGAAMGALFAGSGFAGIYPLVVERIGDRFAGYHPGYYNGIFSIALTGGLLAPCSLGFFAEIWGVRVVMWLPLLGTVMVVVLLLLISLEARLSGGGNLNPGKTDVPVRPRQP